MGCGRKVMQGLGRLFVPIIKICYLLHVFLYFCEVVNAMDSHIPSDVAEYLNSPVAESEVKEALFQMNPNKSLGPGGMLL